MITRTILYISFPCFCAEIERMRHPELASRALIVYMARGNTSGVVFSACPKAKKSGVSIGMSVRRAQRCCEDHAVIKADVAKYEQENSRILDTLAAYTPLLEPDELFGAYIDVTASRNLFGDGRAIAAKIYSKILADFSISLTIGCGSSKLAAKIAASMGRRFASISAGEEADAFAKLAVEELPLVNVKISKRLHELGINNIGRLAAVPDELLVRQFGKAGSFIKRQAAGFDFSQVKAAYPYEIIKSEHTFPSAMTEPSEIEPYLKEMAFNAQMALRKNSSLAQKLTLRLYTESEICIPACFTFKKPTDSAAAIIQPVLKLLAEKMQPGHEIARAEIELSRLSRGQELQLSLMDTNERVKRIDYAMRVIKERFGDSALMPASIIGRSA